MQSYLSALLFMVLNSQIVLAEVHKYNLTHHQTYADDKVYNYIQGCKLENQLNCYIFASHQLQLQVHFENYYTIWISIGKPKQYFQAIIDTGSSELYISSTDCKECIVKKKYDQQRSGSSGIVIGLENDFRFQFYNLNALGNSLREFVCFGIGVNEICAEKLQIAKINKINKIQDDGECSVEAILGLSPLSYFIKSLNSDKQIVGLFLERQELTPEILVGGYNKNLIKNTSEIIYEKKLTEYQNERHWDLKLLHFQIGNITLGLRKQGVVARIDSGGGWILLPFEDYDELFKSILPQLELYKVQRVFSGSKHYWQVPINCSEIIPKFLAIDIVLQSRQFYFINPSYYFKQFNNTCKCLVGGWQQRYILLGQPFLQSYYTILDYTIDQIAFVDHIYKESYQFQQDYSISFVDQILKEPEELKYEKVQLNYITSNEFQIKSDSSNDKNNEL